MSFAYLSLVLLLLCGVLQVTLSCFPLQDVFRSSRLWSQDIRNPWRRLFTIGMESVNVMIIENQAPGSITKARVSCLQKFSGHRYLVRIEDQGPEQFQCMRFTPLAPKIVRKAVTKFWLELTRVNCETEKYFEEKELMIAYEVITPEACPLSGGYQVLLHAPEVKDECQASVNTYNPRMEFSHGGKGDHSVLVDFGKDCAPFVPIQAQSPYRLSFGYYECVGSWDEADGEVKGLLIRNFLNFWCMHYKPVNGSRGEILSVHLSFRGQCSSDVFKNKKDPGEFTSFASFAKYVPKGDNRCAEKDYIHQCNARDVECFASNECPSNCHRCNVEKVRKTDCGFTTAIGRYTGVSAAVKRWRDNAIGDDLTVEVRREGFEVSGVGKFSCWNELNPTDLLDGVYSVVQGNPNSSFPYLFGCAKVSRPSPGVLNFVLLYADRSSQTGEALNCYQSVKGPRLMVPSRNTMITLLDKPNLPTVPCNIPKDSLFPSYLSQCRFLLRKCVDSCDTLQADYDSVSCGNDTGMRLDIEQEHVCHAHLQLKNGARGIITSSVKSGRFRCWLFVEGYLYVIASEKCNSQTSVLNGRDYRRYLEYYDPFSGVTATYESTNSASGNTAVKIVLLLALKTSLIWQMIF